MMKSISYSHDEIMESIIKLHIPSGKIECDPTYSTGNFYKNNEYEPKYKYDIKPQCSGVIQADCRHLPLSDESIESLMFDPPFLATTGKSLKSESGNVINKRFGVYPSEAELWKMYKDSIDEFCRVLKPKGILIFKCQDKVSSGKQYFSHCDIYNYATENGFKAKDLFILLAKNRIVANWQLKNQKHARKFHSYYWVFEKEKQ